MRFLFRWLGRLLVALIVFVLLVAVALPPFFRPLTDRWGATRAEVAKGLPGDSLVKEPDQNSTRAITVNAPPELVFALVKQMGYGRGGWYAWDWFYQLTGSANFVDGHHSKRIDPNLQAFGVGDSMYLFPGAGLEVLDMKQPRYIVMYKKTDEAMKLVPPEAKPKAYSDMTWVWVVEPAGEGATRLILRTRASDVGLGRFAHWINNNFIDFGGAIFGYKTLYGIKRTAEWMQAKGVAVDASGTQIAGPR